MENSLSTTVSGLTVANGKYLLGDALGRGGSGHVFRARRSADSLEVAAKVIPVRDIRDAGALVARYLQVAQLEHPHVLPILDVGVSNEFLYVISPLAAGSLRQHAQLELPAALTLIRQVADALQYVHAHGMVHLDVKPANILLARSCQALLCDFSLEQPEPAPAGHKRVRGTPAYMAPEQCTLRPLGPATDQYALGITSFELLAGRRPFTSSPPDEMLRRQVSETPPLPTSVNPGLPREVDRVLLKALAKDPRARYPDVAAFALALEAAMAGARSVAPPASAGDAERTLEVEVVTIELPRSAARRRM